MRLIRPIEVYPGRRPNTLRAPDGFTSVSTIVEYQVLPSDQIVYPLNKASKLVVAGHVASLALVEVKSVSVGGGGTSPAGGRSTPHQRVEPGNFFLPLF